MEIFFDIILCFYGIPSQAAQVFDNDTDPFLPGNQSQHSLKLRAFKRRAAVTVICKEQKPCPCKLRLVVYKVLD